MMDPAAKGRNSRQRGNSFERVVARKLRDVLGTERTGHWQTIDVSGPNIAIQCKKVAALFPGRIDKLLQEVDAVAGEDQFPAVALASVPGPGGKERQLIVMELDDFVTLLADAIVRWDHEG